MLFLIILILTFAGGFFLPWWAAAIAAFLAALFIGKQPGRCFLAGFVAVALAWCALALLKTVPNNHILASRVAELFHLPGWGWLLALTCVIGGLVGGMAALSGVLLGKAVRGDNG